MNKEKILDSIFFPRKATSLKSSEDHIVCVDQGIGVGVRFYLKGQNFDNIIFFHGNAELAEEYEDIACFYNSHGINLIVADYRGYGLSDGVPSKDNLLSDSPKIFDYVARQLNSEGFDGKKIIMGRSLGSASVWEIASCRLSIVDACIIESGFATEIPLFSLWGLDPDVIGFKLSNGFCNLDKVKKYTKPLFVIHAEKDHIVPLSEAELTYKSALSENKKLLVVESANHNNIIHCIKTKYFEGIRSFIDSL